tara:strand:+ start:106 stop:396 length:291 start_codon:yes stop_codon:yes gene_type:complete
MPGASTQPLPTFTQRMKIGYKAYRNQPLTELETSHYVQVCEDAEQCITKAEEILTESGFHTAKTLKEGAKALTKSYFALLKEHSRKRAQHMANNAR